MHLIHYITKVRYETYIRLKLNINDEIWEHIAELYYKIPCFRKGTNEKRNRRIIISLTTIPSRINKVWLTTESLLRQREKADRIILWLAEDEFRDMKIPSILRKQEKRGLEIRYCSNLKSYKKFYYTMSEFPKDYVLTVDDDCIYSERMVEEMLSASKKYPNTIICNCSHKIRADRTGIFPYLRWFFYENRQKTENNPSYNIFFVGNGGVLFPVWLLNKEILRDDIFMKIAPTADDVWLNFNAWKSRVKIVTTKGLFGYTIPVHSSSDNGLFKKNGAHKAESWECENDVQIRRVIQFLKINLSEFLDMR